VNLTLATMRALLRPTLTLLALAGLSMAVPACGSDDDAAPATTTAAPTTTTAPSTTEPEDTSERAALFIAPVLASGGCPQDPAATTPSTPPGAAPTSTTTASTTTASTTASTTTAATSAGSPGGPFPTADGVFCYTVGEPIGDGNDLTDATLSEAGGDYQVLARVKDESVDDLNAAFNDCFAGSPACPAGEGGRGAVAIVWDGTTLYAPSVQVEDLADGPFAIAGGLTEREARKLLTLINR
jgi:hypothetical protein